MPNDTNAPVPSQTPTPAAAPAPTELPMAEYAAAVNSGKNPILEAQAAAPAPTPSAESTEEEKPAAGSTNDEGSEGTKPAESAPEEDPEKQIDDAHPAKKGIQKRFSEMTAKQKELQALADQRQAEVDAAKREVEQAKAEVARIQAEAAEAAKAAKPIVSNAEDDPLPQRADFADPDDYVIAASAHAARSELRKANEAAQAEANTRAAEAQQRQSEAQQAHIQAQITALHTNFQENVAKIKPEYADYDEKVSNNEKLMLRNDVFFSIERSPDAPHILYHLASNPDVAAKLNGLSQIDAAIHIGELQAELRGARKPKVTKAAEPVKPVGNRSSPQAKKLDEMSMDEYAAHREKEMKQEADRKRPQRQGNR